MARFAALLAGLWAGALLCIAALAAPAAFAVLATADAGVHFISNNIDVNMWWALGSRNGGEVVSADW